MKRWFAVAVVAAIAAVLSPSAIRAVAVVSPTRSSERA